MLTCNTKNELFNSFKLTVNLKRMEINTNNYNITLGTLYFQNPKGVFLACVNVHISIMFNEAVQI